MTPNPTDRPDMTVEEFEQIARAAPDDVRLEFFNGKIEGKPVPDGNHDEMVMWLLEQCMHQRPDLRLYIERGLKVESYRTGRARPDGVLVPRRHFTGAGEWSDPDGVLMVVEVTSHDRDTDQRDRVDKPRGYASAGIPVYLLVDRDSDSLTAHSDPQDGRYRSSTTRQFGSVFELPAPVGIKLETDELKEFAD
jgi:Uma2 family endonuclease